MFLHYLAAAAAAKLSRPFRRITLLKLSLISTSTAGNDTPTGYPEAENTSPMSDFLHNECGLGQSQISTILRKRTSFVRTRSTYTAQQAVQFMRDSGFMEDQVWKLITRNPSILTLNVDRQLKPTIEFMKTLGFTTQEIGIALCRGYRLLGCNLEKTLRPNTLYLQNRLGSETFLKIFKWAPQILGYSKLECLDKKLKHLASFGLLENEIEDLIRMNPAILVISMDKVQKIMDFFIYTEGLPAKFLLLNPLLLYYSLESRIKPRHKVLKAISEMQLSKRLPSLNSVVTLSERNFLEKYVNSSPHATKLLEIYRGNPVGLDIIQ